MKKRKKNLQNKNLLYKIGILFVIISIFLVSIGYSAFRKDLTIENIVSYVEKIVNVRITDFIVDSASDSESYSNSNSFTNSDILTNIHLNDSSSWVKYKVTITNIGNEEVGIRKYLNNLLPSDLKYSVDGYVLGDALCDDDDSSVCTLNSSTTLLITIKYKNGVTTSTPADYDVNIGLDYANFYKVSYADGICDENCPTKVLEGSKLNVIITNFNIINVYMGNLLIGNDLYTFNEETGALVVNRVTGNIKINNLNYEKLLYIETTGISDKQYIDTLYQVNSNTTVIYDGMTVSGDTAIFGYRRSKTTSDIQKFAIQYISANIYRIAFGKIQYELSDTYTINTRYLFKMNNTEAYINNNSIASFENLSNFDTSGNLYLFAINTGGVAGNFGKNRVYSFKIYEGSTLVKNFIPVLDMNNVPCLYETKGEKFYYNKGSGRFNYQETIYYTFTNNMSYLNSSNTNLNIASGERYETTLSAISGHTLPTKITIKSGEILLYNNIDYTYDNQTGKLIINEVHGNIVIDEGSEIELSYLTSSGSQYIKTGYVPTINTKVIFTHIPLVSTPPVWAAYFGTKDSTGNTNTFYVSAGANKVASWVGNTQISASNISFSSTIGSTQVITLSATEFKIVENGITKVNKTSSAIPTFTDAKEIYIFGRNANEINYPGSFRVKSFQIYENDILQMDLIPIIDYEGKYCFYDNISENYFYNQGTGAFTGA